MSHSYDGHDYLSYPQIIDFCTQLSKDYPDWIELRTIGKTTLETPIVMLVIGKNPQNTPVFWMDGGTHASEWTGVMACLYAASQWAKELDTPEGCHWFTHNGVAIVPCVSPDGYQALFTGTPFLRSSLRLPLAGTQRIGLDPHDINGSGNVRFMRWCHPSGPYCLDETAPLGLRKRRLNDPPEQAYFLCPEGSFLEWDGVSYKTASLKHGIDLNRNFPVLWSPFSMFGMDAGMYPLSEPESRALTDALASFKTVCAVLSNHTYTGALLTQPYHPDSVLPASDIDLMQELADQAVHTSHYRTIKVYPDFVYDPKKRIIGVWADFVSSNMGIPAYTLELWNPFEWAGVEIKKPAEFFGHPDPNIVNGMLKKACSEAPVPWTSFAHPQLGEVEIGGFVYLKTIRNPPPSLLQKECEHGLIVANNLRKSMPIIHLSHDITPLPNGWFSVCIILENQGFLSSVITERAHGLSLAAKPKVTLKDNPGPSPDIQYLPVLEGWGTGLYKQNAVYPNLSARSPRSSATFVLPKGDYRFHWDAGRGGSGVHHVTLS